MDDHRRTQAALGAHIRAIRLDRAMTQAELAQEMRPEFRTWRIDTVSKIESGDRALLATEAVRLAALLGVPLQKLLERP